MSPKLNGSSPVAVSGRSKSESIAEFSSAVGGAESCGCDSGIGRSVVMPRPIGSDVWFVVGMLDACCEFVLVISACVVAIMGAVGIVICGGR